MNLQEQLEQVTAARVSRYNNALYILKHPELFEELSILCFSSDKKMATKASWVFEFVCKEKIALLEPYCDYYIEHLPRVTHDSIKRPLSRILLVLLEKLKKDNSITKYLNKSQEQQIIEMSFDWLIGDEKVAIKCYCMRILFLLGKNYDWVHPELKLILEQNIAAHSPAYKAAAKDILKKMHL
ncbi:hypothetical protein NBRC110019_27880 [Neptunitalea chrysea]|uniref:Adenylosuccinate lyase n=1 Tax=Neptunitalea chrysea TaxID=1647581 RepID=A0A9W6B888_9FLAO|nr:hypothetical protein [Neptunitalea chrysea]GLB53747.1 hypothetical protein NBRC110019_27880 [Neptunitalea chrysea]